MNKNELLTEIERLNRVATNVSLEMEVSADPDLEDRLYHLEREINYLADLYHEAEE